MIAGVGVGGGGGLAGARGLSSAQIKRSVGLVSIALLIGPHLSARRGVGSGWRKCASWHGDHRHPRCSAVISHPQSPSLHPSHPRHLSALPSRLRCASASSPTSTPPPPLSLPLFPAVLTWHLDSSLPRSPSISTLSLGRPLAASSATPTHPSCVPSGLQSPFNSSCEDCSHSCVCFFRPPCCCPALSGLSQQASHSRIYLVLLCLLVTHM